jgi:hypothetical protein
MKDRDAFLLKVRWRNTFGHLSLAETCVDGGAIVPCTSPFAYGRGPSRDPATGSSSVVKIAVFVNYAKLRLPSSAGPCSFQTFTNGSPRAVPPFQEIAFF